VKRQVLAPGIAELYEAPISPEEFARRSAVPPTDEEVAEFMELVRWFTRRYPTAKERFAYVRRKYAEWTRNPPVRIDAEGDEDTPRHAGSRQQRKPTS
jgi:hypothetical protein